MMKGMKNNMKIDNYTFYDYAIPEFETYLGKALSNLSNKNKEYKKLRELINEESKNILILMR